MNPPTPIPLASVAHADALLQHLSRIADEWQVTGLEPRTAADLSRDEYRALCVAVGRPQLLLNPAIDFLALPEDLRLWAGEYFRVDSKRRGFDHHQRLCERQSDSTRRAQETMLAQLGSMAEEWRRSGVEPADAGSLSAGEYVAVCLAAGSAALANPLRAFLDLEGWLQAWVLRQRGLAGYVGTVVGHPERW